MAKLNGKPLPFAMFDTDQLMAVAAGECDPYAAADELIATI